MLEGLIPRLHRFHSLSTKGTFQCFKLSMDYDRSLQHRFHQHWLWAANVTTTPWGQQAPHRMPGTHHLYLQCSLDWVSPYRHGLSPAHVQQLRESQRTLPYPTSFPIWVTQVSRLYLTTGQQPLLQLHVSLWTDHSTPKLHHIKLQFVWMYAKSL